MKFFYIFLPLLFILSNVCDFPLAYAKIKHYSYPGWGFARESDMIEPGITILTRHTDGTGIRSYCTGAFIGRNIRTHQTVMLTAAHCLDEPKQSHEVYMMNLHDQEVPIGYTSIINPERNNKNGEIWVANDIGAITITNRTIPINPAIEEKITVNSVFTHGSLIHKTLLIAGSEDFTDKLIPQKVISIKNNVISTQSLGTPVMEGDSGAPIFYRDPQGKVAAVGILSNAQFHPLLAHFLHQHPEIQLTLTP